MNITAKKNNIMTKALITFDTVDEEEFHKILKHHIDYMIDFDDMSDVISSAHDITFYDTDERRDTKKLQMISSILDDILNVEPTAKDLDYDDDAMSLYEQLKSLKATLDNMGL